MAKLDPYPRRSYGTMIPLVFCLVALMAAGCVQKPSWKPPEEPKTATPPPEQPPRIDSQVFYVAADKLNLRACPGMDCPRIVTLTRNQEVEKVGESQGWYQVRSRQDGTLGWVDGRYLASTPVADSAVLPSETAPPRQIKPGETKAKVKTSAPILVEEPEEAPPPKKRRKPDAEAAETPSQPAAEPVEETPPAPAPAAPTDSGKKKIRIM